MTRLQASNEIVPREVWFWLTHLEAHLEVLDHSIAAVPSLESLRVVTYCDPNSTAVVLSMSFLGSPDDLARLLLWGQQASLEHLDQDRWSIPRRLRFREDIAHFRFAGESSHPLVEFAARIAIASMSSAPVRHTRLAVGTMADGLVTEELDGESADCELDFELFSESTVRQFTGIIEIARDDRGTNS